MDDFHATLRVDANGEITVFDNNSRDGVWMRISKHDLKHGNQFMIGEQRMLFLS